MTRDVPARCKLLRLIDLNGDTQQFHHVQASFEAFAEQLCQSPHKMQMSTFSAQQQEMHADMICQMQWKTKHLILPETLWYAEVSRIEVALAIQVHQKAAAVVMQVP